MSAFALCLSLSLLVRSSGKLCNNLCLAVSMIGVSEAMSLGSKMGMDPKVS